MKSLIDAIGRERANNAIVDALAEFGVTHIDMPATPEKVWRAIQSAPKKKAAE